MARILGVDIPENKRTDIALTYVYGVGHALSLQILSECNIDPHGRAKDLTDEDLANIRSSLEKNQIPIEGELRRMISQNVRRLQDIKSYRGARHSKGLPVRGQRTSTNARTRKGKKKTVGGAQKKASAKK